MSEQLQEILEKDNPNQEPEEYQAEQKSNRVYNKEPQTPIPEENYNKIENNKASPITTPFKNSLDVLSNPSIMDSVSLSQAKKLLKQIEEEQKILNNRVELLEVEKFKMDRNIKQTKSKTSQILSMKQEHLNQMKARELSEKNENEFRHFLQQKIQQRKRDKNEIIKKSLEKNKQKQRDLIQKIKQDNQTMIQYQKLMNLQNNQNQAAIIKRFEEMKKKELQRLKENQINLIMKENQLEISKLNQLATQKKLEMLEKEKQEQNLMMQLQKTQLVQKDALEQLESAFTLPINNLEESLKNQLIPLNKGYNKITDQPFRARTYKLKKSKTFNKIKLQSLPPWNSCTVVQKFQKSSLASFFKHREKIHSQAQYKGQFHDYY